MDAQERTAPAETFQELVLRLMTFWANKGCLLTQPFDAEKGAGTYNPSTFLKAIGPEPWSAAYVEPSRRPTDGRYGENPNRLYRHHQFQVLLKPSPPDLQGLYLDSLRAIGIHPEEHDIRFVEDNWESPTLGAWGLGWEVWVDGMEATQFTYFQQCGGLECRPVSGELTYGMERLAMYLQNVDNVYDLAYAPGVKYGQVFHQDEVEYSKFSFESLDVQLYGDLYDRMEKETERLVSDGLVIPAYDHLLHAAHAFNALDAKGAISVTERQGYILRIRDLAKLTAEAYLSSREALGFPLGTLEAKDDENRKAPRTPETKIAYSEGGTFFVELGTEELPAGEVLSAAKQLADGLCKRLDELGLSYGKPEIFCTPRRLALRIPDVPGHQEDKTLEISGPPVKAAFRNGEPTKAAIGFAKTHGLSPSELIQRQTPKGEYLFAVVEQKGKSAAELLPVAVEESLSSISFKRSMRWGTGTTTFSRPVVWLTVSHGGHVLPASFAGISSQPNSYGHRFLDPKAIDVASRPESYEAILQEHKVLVVPSERRDRILTGANKLAEEVGGHILENQALLDEITQLVEWPVMLRGEFDESFLSIPKEVLISEMVEHQRYIPILGRNGRLLPYFVVVANTYVEDPQLSLNGYRRVLTARFSDGAFFFEEDQKQPLVSRFDALAKVRFHRALGTIHDKVQRYVYLSFQLANLLSGQEEDIPTSESLQKQLKIDQDLWAFAQKSTAEKYNDFSWKLARAGFLAKADLTTLMVYEFPELQGVMGAAYASIDGEPQDVSEAIQEHYLPRGAEDELPKGLLGALVGLADRFDTIIGIFTVGKGPSGAADPYGLRRATLAIIRILRERNWHLSINEAICLAYERLEKQQKKSQSEVATEVGDFFRARLKAALVSEGIPTDVAEAALSAGSDDVVDASHRARALAQLRMSEDFAPLAETFKRVANILKGNIEAAPQRKGLTEAAEQKLYDAQVMTDKKVADAISNKRYDIAFGAVAQLRPVIDEFFAQIMVMVDDKEVRARRIGLLSMTYQTFAPLADFTKLS